MVSDGANERHMDTVNFRAWGIEPGYKDALGAWQTSPPASLALVRDSMSGRPAPPGPSYRDVWEQVLPETRDPYEITARFEEAFARHPAHVDAYRNRFAFHPIHGILATHPLRRLRRVGRVIVAGARDAHVPRHLGWETAPSVEDAVGRAMAAHGRGATIGVVEQAGMPEDPDRGRR